MEYIAHLIKNAVFLLVAIRVAVVLIVLYAGYRLITHTSWFKRIRNMW